MMKTEPSVGPPANVADEVPDFERLLSKLSARFINLPAAEVDGAITDALRQFITLLDVDRCQLIRFNGSGEADLTHSWAVPGVPRAPRKLITDEFPWVIASARAGRAVVVPHVSELPPEAAVDKASFRRIGTQSHLAMPLVVGGSVSGMVSFACLRRQREWPSDLVARVRVLADVFGNALAHKRAQEALDSAMRFERTVSSVLGRLLTAGPADQPGLIESGLREMAGVFRVERATLWQRSDDRKQLTKSHRWTAGGVPVAPDSVGIGSLPWISAQVLAGSVVRLSRSSVLPAEAAADGEVLQGLGIRSGVFVPLAVAGEVVGALSFGTAREELEWPDELVARVRIFGEVLASLLRRQETEQREREAQAQAAHASRVATMGLFASSLVHELTQPIAASLANAESAAELLAAPAPDIDELRATVADIVSDDRRSGELIQQLRRFLRRGESTRTEINLREAIGQSLRLVTSQANDHGIEVAVDATETLPSVVGDAVQIQQVLLNMLLNAFDAVADGSSGSRRVELLALRTENGVRIDVKDFGKGMDEATKARIFQPFFTTKPNGMGLGLSISRTIVAAHGGNLSVHSAPGRGSTFSIDLPVRTVEVPATRSASKRSPQQAGTVFVIDDDPSMLRALERQLTGAGHRVESFPSAQAFLECTRDVRGACIVSDIRMPGMSGLDLQAALARANRELPIVFISGHGDTLTTVHAMKAGAVNFLPKPFTKGELLAAVTEALARGLKLDDERNEQAGLRARFESLTPREREVFALVAQGCLNKVIADRLGAAEPTIKIHRGRVMEKMRADSAADLVRMAERLGSSSVNSPTV